MKAQEMRAEAKEESGKESRERPEELIDGQGDGNKRASRVQWYIVGRQ